MLSAVNARSMLKGTTHIPEKARFPVVDLHNHLFARRDADELLSVMDQVGVQVFNNVSGNAVLPYVDNTYTIERVDFSFFAQNYIAKHPDRFMAFTMSDFAQWGDMVLFKKEDFVEMLLTHLQEDVRQGARGLKITKELGLRFTDPNGDLIRIDDQRLDPVWRRCGQLGIPVLIHVSDPAAFFLPVEPSNEHFPTLQEFPAWSFYRSFFSKTELLQQRDTVIARYPLTTFILPHVANNPEDLASVAQLLDRFANTYIDFSARIDELGRQPYSAREFFIAYQERILFGLDMPVSVESYRCYFRFLETWDQYFDYPDYIGRWGHSRWKIYGLGLEDTILRKIYYANAQKLFPDLKI